MLHHLPSVWHDPFSTSAPVCGPKQFIIILTSCFKYCLQIWRTILFKPMKMSENSHYTAKSINFIEYSFLESQVKWQKMAPGHSAVCPQHSFPQWHWQWCMLQALRDTGCLKIQVPTDSTEGFYMYLYICMLRYIYIHPQTDTWSKLLSKWPWDFTSSLTPLTLKSSERY